MAQLLPKCDEITHLKILPKSVFSLLPASLDEHQSRQTDRSDVVLWFFFRFQAAAASFQGEFLSKNATFSLAEKLAIQFMQSSNFIVLRPSWIYTAAHTDQSLTSVTKDFP